jgi:hypothetical protein
LSSSSSQLGSILACLDFSKTRFQLGSISARLDFSSARGQPYLSGSISICIGSFYLLSSVEPWYLTVELIHLYILLNNACILCIIATVGTKLADVYFSNTIIASSHKKKSLQLMSLRLHAALLHLGLHKKVRAHGSVRARINLSGVNFSWAILIKLWNLIK